MVAPSSERVLGSREEPASPWPNGSFPTAPGWPALASTVLIAGVNVLAVTGYRPPFLGPAAGFWFLVVLPVYLLYTTSVWGPSPAAERLGYSLAAALLLLMLAGLGINTVLPLVGVHRPLDTVPVVILGDGLTAALYLLRRRYPAKVAWRAALATVKPEESRLIAWSGACVALAVLGANRLNNGAGDQLSLAALGGVVLTLVLLLLWRQQVRDGMTSVTLYLLSLALLLMTSLRGWFVTGHDIQLEYRVFQLTEAHGHWGIAYLRNPYNACLSITILPTEMARIVDVDGPYVYKLFFQLIFAACPPLAYAISRRYWSPLISILAAVYFVGFPTFFTDMPFLNRQEIAFLFVCVGTLAITNASWSVRVRQVALVAASTGVELSHYSTMYLFLGTLLAAWAARHAFALCVRIWRRRTRSAQAGPPRAVTAWTVGAGLLLVVAAIVFAWGELATQTAAGAVVDVESAVSGFTGHSVSVRSGDVSYSLLHPATADPQTVLREYRDAAFQARVGAPAGTYVPAAIVDRYPVSAVSGYGSLPLTGVGRLISRIGGPVAALNGAVRQAAARGEQLFIAIGLITCLVAGRLRRRLAHEYFCLCVGSVAVVAVVTLFPDISTDYGVLRAFQGALILAAPVLAAGSLAVFRLAVFRLVGRGRGPQVAAAVGIGFLASTTGLMPQLLGGYPAQLSLDNSGSYYDMYYMHPQEMAAVAWLAGKPGVLPGGLAASFIPGRFAFTSPSDVTGQQVVTDIYPPLVRQSGWVILGYSTVHTGLAATFYDGDLLTYAYPMGFLQASKNLVYNNGGTEIYK
jgi:uncharacterized membrane protein